MDENQNFQTGLDDLVRIIFNDSGLNRWLSEDKIEAGAAAAAGMNELIEEAIHATGVANNGIINAADARDINAYIRANYLERWAELHGDDGPGIETGFHLVEHDGGTTQLFGKNAIDTVADNIYHLGFEATYSQFRNEDGSPDARIKDVAYWVNELLKDDLASGALKNDDVDPYVEGGTTGTGLDALVDTITGDPGLNLRIPTSEIADGARAADKMNKIIVEAIQATGVANNGIINAADAREINAYIQEGDYNVWVELHGDDEGDEETGFHLVQNDGATTQLFGKNAIDTVADGIYHMGFDATYSQFLNEDGAPNAKIEDVASWLSEFLEDDLASGALKNDDVDPYVEGGTTGTGLDALVDTITGDPGLNLRIPTSEIADGARAADKMNKIIVEAIQATGVAKNGIIDATDSRDVNAYIRANYLERWAELHGDDGPGIETGFHLVEHDGGTTQLFGLNAIDTVADNIYNLGFEATYSQFRNQDGSPDARIKDVAYWVNELLKDDLVGGALVEKTADPDEEGSDDVYVSFVSENAGYKNTYGWYNVDTLQARILVANVDTNTNSDLEKYTEKLPFTVNQLQDIGFFLIPDGYDQNRGAGEPLAAGDGTGLNLEVYKDGSAWKIRDADTGYLFEGTGSAAYFTEAAKNPGGFDHVIEDGDIIADGEET